jgi:hypothetical protein
MPRRFIGPVLVVVGVLLGCVVTATLSHRNPDLAGLLVILMTMVAGTGIGLTVSWSDDRRP